jgi:CTP:molybdopterin cytidylyltransferase MocA
MSHFQPMLKLNGKSVIRRQIDAFRAAGVDDILIVSGFHSGMLERHLAGETVRFVKNEEYATTDMMASVQCALRALSPECDRVLITPGDVPYLNVETIEELLHSTKPVAIPSFRGSAGHPAMIRKSCFSSLLSYKGERGLRGALAQWKKDTEFVQTDENGMLVDINTELDYQREQREQTRVSPVLTAALTVSLGETGIDERGIRLLEASNSSSRSSARGKSRAIVQQRVANPQPHGRSAWLPTGRAKTRRSHRRRQQSHADGLDGWRVTAASKRSYPSLLTIQHKEFN